MSRVDSAGAAPASVARLTEPTQASRASAATPLRHRIPFLLVLVVLALGLRVGAAVAFDQYLTASGRGGFLSEDEFGYDRVAWAQAQAWRGVGPPVNPGDAYLLNPYTYTEAAVYVGVGHRPLAMKLVNCLFGALTAGLIYLIARKLFGEAAGRFSGIVTAFFPTTFLFSIVNLKDAMFLFIVALLFWVFGRLLATARQWLILPVLGMLAVVGSLRIYFQGIFVGLIPVTVVLQEAARFPRRWLTAIMLFAGCLAILWYSGGAQWIVGYAPFINQQRYASAQGARSAYVVLPTAVPPSAGRGDAATPRARPVDPLAVPTTMPPPTRGSATVRGLLTWLPMGLSFAIAAPFPWTARRVIEQLTIPEMLLWYALLVLAAIGLRKYWREWRSYIHLVGYIAGVFLILAIGQGNLGTLIRQRSMMIAPFVFIFSGAGAVWLWGRWGIGQGKSQ